MEGFDDVGVFFSDNFNPDGADHGSSHINLQAVKKKFKEFIRTFNEDNFHYKYRYVVVAFDIRMMRISG